MNYFRVDDQPLGHLSNGIPITPAPSCGQFWKKKCQLIQIIPVAVETAGETFEFGAQFRNSEPIEAPTLKFDSRQTTRWETVKIAACVKQMVLFTMQFIWNFYDDRLARKFEFKLPPGTSVACGHFASRQDAHGPLLKLPKSSQKVPDKCDYTGRFTCIVHDRPWPQCSAWLSARQLGGRWPRVNGAHRSTGRSSNNWIFLPNVIDCDVSA